MTIPKVRVRTKTPKTKTGCRTCRIRHIKCDEVKPECDRCTSTGRKCDGYETDVNRSMQVTRSRNGGPIEWLSNLSSRRPWYLPLSNLSLEEGQAFTFFRQHTASQLQDGMRSQLWDRWTMQISHQEPAILHAIIAVGAMHHARGNNQGDGFGKLQQVALANYSKAVIKLQGLISQQKKGSSLDIILLACILFIGFEMLQHDMALAMQHLQLGLNIMTNKYSNCDTTNEYKPGSIVIKGSPNALLDELVPIFVRLDYGAPMFGRRHPLLDLSHDEYNLQHSLSVPQSFDSILQAKSYLDLLSSGVFRLRGDLMDVAETELLDSGFDVQSMWSICYLQALSRSVDLGTKAYSLLLQKQSLEAGLAAFWRAFEELVISNDLRTDRAAMAIQIQYILIFFTVKTCRDTYETACDGFQDLFETAIELAERYITYAPGYDGSNPQRNLSLEPGVIPTIFLVAQKCRQQRIRAKAIDLLELGCRREAMWDGRPFAAFMQHLSDVETERSEKCLYERTHDRKSNESVSIDTVDSIESARFCDVVVADELDELGRGILLCARYKHETDEFIEIVEHKFNLPEQTIGPTCGTKQSFTPMKTSQVTT